MVEGIRPKLRWKIGANEEGPDSICKCPMSSFTGVLMRGTGSCGEDLVTMLGEDFSSGITTI